MQMPRKIAVLTGTRAEYGLLYWTMKAIQASDKLELLLFVTGAHLSPEYGMTVNDIINDGFPITECIEMLVSSDSKQGMAKSMGILVLGFAQALAKNNPDVLLVLGDRYEAYAAASTALLMNIPIAHIAGGELTEGAIDDQLRHAITKISHLHFTGADEYSERILKMGEENWRVIQVGDTGIENIKRIQKKDIRELSDHLKTDLTRTTLIVVFHPVTLELDDLHYQVDNLLTALDVIYSTFDCNILFSYPNADAGGRYIINQINDFTDKHPNTTAFTNLGSVNYISLLSHCSLLVGNSSSGIAEAPFLKIPVVNIGSRQKGRLLSDCIINTGYDSEDILNGIKKALSNGFKAVARNAVSVYGEGDSSSIIVDTLESVDLSKLLNKKMTY